MYVKLYTIIERPNEYGDVIATVYVTNRKGHVTPIADYPSLADAVSAIAEFKATVIAELSRNCD